MKKLLAVLLSVSMLLALTPAMSVAAETVERATAYHLSFETAEDVALGAASAAKKELAVGGVLGSSSALKVTTTTNTGTVKYPFKSRPGDVMNISVWLKPLDAAISSPSIIFYHDCTDPSDSSVKSAFEQENLTVGETRADGYTRYYLENYTMHAEAKTKFAGETANAFHPKDIGADGYTGTTVEFRVNATGSYLMDEMVIEPYASGNVIAYEDFFNPSEKSLFFTTSDVGSGNFVEGMANGAYVATKDTASGIGDQLWYSDKFDAQFLWHNQANYRYNTTNGGRRDGAIYCTGSGTSGVFFQNVTVMPHTYYKLTANVNVVSDIDYYFNLYIKDNVNSALFDMHSGASYQFPFSGAGNKQVEFIFRTKDTTGINRTDSQQPVTIDRIGICAQSKYFAYMVDSIKLEKLDTIVYGGDFENGQVAPSSTVKTSSGAGKNAYYENVYNGKTTYDHLFYGDDDYTHLDIVSDDASNAGHGKYLKVTYDSSAVASGTNRRLVTALDLKASTTYRLTFRAKMAPDEVYTATTGALGGMYFLGTKVDANGKIDGEDGFNSSTANWGYINGFDDTALTTEWKEYTNVFTTNPRQVSGQLYLGLGSFGPADGGIVAFDDIQIEEIGTTYYDAAIAANGNNIAVTESTGAQVASTTQKSYEFYVSEDGVDYVLEDVNTTGSFVGEAGKFYKAVVVGKDAEGEVVAKSKETSAVKITGYALKFTSDLSGANVTATATYYPEAEEVEVFEGIIALYNAAGELLAVDSFESANNAAALTIPTEEGTAKAKIFAWETLEGAIPVAKPVGITK